MFCGPKIDIKLRKYGNVHLQCLESLCLGLITVVDDLKRLGMVANVDICFRNFNYSVPNFSTYSILFHATLSPQSYCSW